MPEHPVRTILVLSDRIRGHLTQSRGVAQGVLRLLERGGLPVPLREMEVPEVQGVEA